MSILSVRLGEEEDAALRAAAADQGVTRADVIRALISDKVPDAGAVWIAYFEDESGCVPFGSEVAALRYAVEHDMKVIRVPFGEYLSETIRSERDMRRLS